MPPKSKSKKTTAVKSKDVNGNTTNKKEKSPLDDIKPNNVELHDPLTLEEAHETINKLRIDNNFLYEKSMTVITASEETEKRYSKLKNNITSAAKSLNIKENDEIKSDVDRICDLLVRIKNVASNPPSVESRLEELETRISQLNSQMMCLNKNCLLYENLLTDILKLRDIEKIHNRISNAFVESGKVIREAKSICERIKATDHLTLATPYIKLNSRCLSAKSSHSIALHSSRIPEKLLPPERKLPGSTHISQLNIDLRGYICNELNLMKKAGNDWRMLAKRVGIDMPTIKNWEELRLSSPTNRILVVWGRSPNATVRMLHRYLSVPEMHSSILLKRIEDFYWVD